jgi:hypothetical protein
VGLPAGTWGEEPWGDWWADSLAGNPAGEDEPYPGWLWRWGSYPSVGLPGAEVPYQTGWVASRRISAVRSACASSAPWGIVSRCWSWWVWLIWLRSFIDCYQ